MAEIYRIGSDDLVDRVSTFGGTNLALATSYDQFGIDTYTTKENVTFLGDNKVKIEAGGKLGRSSSNYIDLPSKLSINSNILMYLMVYENTLNVDCECLFGIKRTASGTYLYSKNIPANFTGLHLYSMKWNGDIYGIVINSINASSATSGYIVLGPLKTEIGTKPTDWTPAPHDLVTYDSSSESLVFFQ